MPVPLDTKTVIALIRDATTAPSLHNSQPWRFRFLRTTSTLELHADQNRALPQADPFGRALHIGCGACLFTLRVAALHHGLRPLTALLPDPGQRPGLLATVQLLEPAPPGTDVGALHPAVRRRHSSRYPYAPTPIEPEIRDALQEAAAAEEGQLVFPDAAQMSSLLDLTEEGRWRDLVDPRRVAELRRWTRAGTPASDTATDGVPDFAFGPRRRHGLAPVRNFAPGLRQPRRDAADFEEQPQLALLGTDKDTRADWLRAGQALQRVLLVATLHDLAASLATEALEWEDLRRALPRALRTPEGTGPACAQAVLRLGYGPWGPASRRRPVRDVLDIDTE